MLISDNLLINQTRQARASSESH